MDRVREAQKKRALAMCSQDCLEAGEGHYMEKLTSGIDHIMIICYIYFFLSTLDIITI